MKQLLNTLFITSEDIYLSLDGENVVANRDKEQVGRFPLHTLQNIVVFSYAGASPALMGACAQRQIGLAFCTPRGRFLARVCQRRPVLGDAQEELRLIDYDLDWAARAREDVLAWWREMEAAQ